MEKSLCEAAKVGNVNLLRQLLQQDALLLDRFIVGCHTETPLHIASMLGHLEFVQEILTQKPELAKELDSRKASPLHLATAKGYLEIVKRLLQANPNMCSLCDQDGRNPPHIAAIKGRVIILRDLVHAKPHAARAPMNGGDTILHACVRHNQLEAMRFLVEAISDPDFLNYKNYDGNTVLHLAVADRQLETVNFLVTTRQIEVNLTNADGLAALDILSQNEREVKDKEIAESLRNAGAVRVRSNPLSKNELEAMRRQILSSISSNQQEARQPKKKHKKFVNKDWLERKKNSLMIVASLIATMAFQGCLTPPGGLWQDNSKGHIAGQSVLAEQPDHLYSRFLTSNTIGLVASLSIIFLLVSGLPLRHRVVMWMLMVVMWIAITAMAFTYLVAIAAYTPDYKSAEFLRALGLFVLVWIGLMLILLLGHTIRLFIRLVRYICQLQCVRHRSRTQMA